MDARSWEMPNPPVLAGPDRFMHARLRLDDAWLGPRGEWRPLSTEPIAALWSILGYLRWHAPALRAQDADGDAFADPDSFIAARTLVRAIDAELAHRGAIAGGDALTTLRAMGQAPWELRPDQRRRRRRRAAAASRRR